MNFSAFENIAKELGFSAAYSVSPAQFLQWAAVTAEHRDERWAGLAADPKLIMPEVKSVVVLVWPYAPYGEFPQGSPAIDAYYPASQSAHFAAKQLGEILKNQGFQADTSPNIPARPALLRTGLVRYGRNALASMGEWGTRVNLQMILTDAPFETMDNTPDNFLSDNCAHCNSCAQICPVGAIMPGGRIDPQKCLRAQSYAEIMPEEYRALIGNSILGCDICQRICPRNANVQTVSPPEELVDALRLERLLVGDTKPLAKLIGSNYARSVRMQSRAALVAANLGRKDLIPLVQKLCESPFDHVRAHAIWAVERLK